VHPAVLNSYLDGTMIESLRHEADREIEESLGDLKPEEAAVMGLLRNRLAHEEEGRTHPRSGRAAARLTAGYRP
jgi:DNA topoisomerase-1